MILHGGPMDIHLLSKNDQITKDNSPIPKNGIGEYLILLVLVNTADGK